MRTIPLFYPYIPRWKILRELYNTLGTRWIGQGPKVEQFEKEFGKKFGYEYPVFVNSGTSALELAYHLIGLRAGDEVIVPVLNCTAGLTGLVRRGVRIVFADIDKDTLCIDWRDMEKKVTKKTRAIMVVHLGGIEASGEVYDVAFKRKIPLIVDAAQYMDVTYGDYICYSFQAIKHFTTGDGGMLVVKNEGEYSRAKKLRWFGIDREQKAKKNFQAWKEREMTFDIEEAGYKYQPTDIDASLGLVGLRDIDMILHKRQRLVQEYRVGLDGNPGIHKIVAGGTYWLMGIICNGYRDELADDLEGAGIETNLVHLRNDIFKVFGGKRQKLKIMDAIEPEYLYLPLHTRMDELDVMFICERINEFYRNIEASPY